MNFLLSLPEKKMVLRESGPLCSVTLSYDYDNNFAYFTFNKPIGLKLIKVIYKNGTQSLEHFNGSPNSTYSMFVQEDDFKVIFTDSCYDTRTFFCKRPEIPLQYKLALDPNDSLTQLLVLNQKIYEDDTLQIRALHGAIVYNDKALNLLEKYDCPDLGDWVYKAKDFPQMYHFQCCWIKFKGLDWWPCYLPCTRYALPPCFAADKYLTEQTISLYPNSNCVKITLVCYDANQIESFFRSKLMPKQVTVKEYDSGTATYKDVVHKCTYTFDDLQPVDCTFPFVPCTMIGVNVFFEVPLGGKPSEMTFNFENSFLIDNKWTIKFHDMGEEVTDKCSQLGSFCTMTPVYLQKSQSARPLTLYFNTPFDIGPLLPTKVRVKAPLYTWEGEAVYQSSNQVSISLPYIQKIFYDFIIQIGYNIADDPTTEERWQYFTIPYYMYNFNSVTFECDFVKDPDYTYKFLDTFTSAKLNSAKDWFDCMGYETGSKDGFTFYSNIWATYWEDSGHSDRFLPLTYFKARFTPASEDYNIEVYGSYKNLLYYGDVYTVQWYIVGIFGVPYFIDFFIGS